jgi:hypothetical protein
MIWFVVVVVVVVLFMLPWYLTKKFKRREQLLDWQLPFVRDFDVIQREARQCLSDVVASTVARPKMLDAVDFRTIENVWVRGPETKLTDDWLNFAFVVDFQRVQSNLHRCPSISKCLFEAQLSGARIRVCGLSWLKGGKTIGKHRDFNDNAVPWHLGVIVPHGKCKLIVGNNVFIHREKEWLTFGQYEYLNCMLFLLRTDNRLCPQMIQSLTKLATSAKGIELFCIS